MIKRPIAASSKVQEFPTPLHPPPFFFFRNRDVGLFSLFLSFSFVVCVEIVLIFLIGKKG